jgi:hypothetical protein
MKEDAALAKPIMPHKGVVIGQLALLEDGVFERVGYTLISYSSIHIHKFTVIVQIDFV